MPVRCEMSLAHQVKPLANYFVSLLIKIAMIILLLPLSLPLVLLLVNYGAAIKFTPLSAKIALPCGALVPSNHEPQQALYTDFLNRRYDTFSNKITAYNSTKNIH